MKGRAVKPNLIVGDALSLRVVVCFGNRLCRLPPVRVHDFAVPLGNERFQQGAVDPAQPSHPSRKKTNDATIKPLHTLQTHSESRSVREGIFLHGQILSPSLSWREGVRFDRIATAAGVLCGQTIAVFSESWAHSQRCA